MNALRKNRFIEVPLSAAGLTVEALLADYVDLVSTVAPPPLTQRVSRDPDDDAVLACAVAAHADVIVGRSRYAE